jgi:hypothetical protein
MRETKGEDKGNFTVKIFMELCNVGISETARNPNRNDICHNERIHESVIHA